MSKHEPHPMTPFEVLRLDHVVFRVGNPQRSIDFYREVLGCEIVRRRDDLGLIHLRVGVSMIDLVAVDGPLGVAGGGAPRAEGRNVDHVCLRVEPYDQAAIQAHLTRLGVSITDIAAHNFGAEGVGPSLYIKDPDGNTIELKGPAHADERPGA